MGVTQNGCALECAANGLKANREIVMAAVTQNGYALECAANELKANREIVMAAVTQNGCALQFAADNLRGDLDITLAYIDSVSNRRDVSLTYLFYFIERNLDLVVSSVNIERPC